ncbi:MAG: hypothetical protein AB1649_09980, partial [Chloroflexota bacterium]
HVSLPVKSQVDQRGLYPHLVLDVIYAEKLTHESSFPFQVLLLLWVISNPKDLTQRRQGAKILFFLRVSAPLR